VAPINGDKARFGQRRERKILLRRRMREVRKKLKNSATGPTLAAPELVGITPLTIGPTGAGQ